MDFQIERLQTMKRAELQKLCKTFGIKANMKTAQLIKALVQHSAKEKSEKPVENIPDNEGAGSEITTEAIKVLKDTKNSEDKKLILSHVKDTEKKESVEQKSKLIVLQEEAKSLKGQSKIPRLTGLKLNKKNGDCSTPSNDKKKTPSNIKNKTPKHTGPKDWNKIHQKEFNKMDSLGDYLEKKRKRAEELGSVKKVKLLTREDKHEKHKEPQNTPKCPGNITPKSQQVKSVEKKVDFRRKTLTFNFSKSTKENAVTPGELKRRATLCVTKQPTEVTQNPVTPFRFSAAPNTSFMSPTPRKVFDLKASLAKPLNYKPYTGKLPTPPYIKQNAKMSVKKMKIHERDVKAVKLTSRRERHDLQIKNQSKRRADCIRKRRGDIC